MAYDAIDIRMSHAEAALAGKVNLDAYRERMAALDGRLRTVDEDIDSLEADIKAIREDQRKILQAQLSEGRRTTLTVTGIAVTVIFSAASLAITIAIGTGMIGAP